MGGNSAIIVQILAVLLILFFFFLTYMFTKTWRWHHVMFAFLVFPAALTFVVYAAMSLKTHSAWKAKVKELETKVAQEQEALDRLMQGEPGEAGAGTSVQALKAELARLMLDRGRVWRHCTPTGVQGNAIQISTVAEGADAEGASNQLQPKDQLYVFSEVQTPDGMRIPDVFLGEFLVASATETDVTITPVAPPDQLQTATINQGGTTWALYEVMPHDNPYAFSDMEPDADHLFGSVDENELRELFQNRYNLPADVFEQNLQRYLRNGTQLQPDDPPETRWARVEFLRPHEVQVDSADVRNVFEGGYFDGDGRAVDQALRHSETGEPVKFKIGDMGVFPEEEANRLVEANIAKMDKAVYVRALSDYGFLFWSARERRKELNRAIYVANRESETVQDAITRTEEAISYRTEERDKLEVDHKKMEVERNEIKKYRDELARHWSGLQTRANEAYRANLLLAKQLDDISHQLTEEINRRTAEITSAGP